MLLVKTKDVWVMENVHRSNLVKRSIYNLLMRIGIVKKPPDNWIHLSKIRAIRRKAEWSNISQLCVNSCFSYLVGWLFIELNKTKKHDQIFFWPCFFLELSFFNEVVIDVLSSEKYGYHPKIASHIFEIVGPISRRVHLKQHLFSF